MAAADAVPLEDLELDAPATVNPHLATQGAKAKAFQAENYLAEDPGVMDPRHAAYKRGQEQGEELGLGLDLVTSALPLGGVAAKGVKALAEEAGSTLLRSGARAQGGAVKLPGGNWHPEAVDRLAKPLAEPMYSREAAAGEPGVPLPSERWAQRAVKGYLNKHAGTATDPLKDLEIPHGEGTARWEDLTDKAIQNAPAKYYSDVKAGGLEEPVYTVGEHLNQSVKTESPLETANRQDANNALKSYLSHVGDYLKQNVSPEKLGQYDLVRAVKETSQNDVRVAKAMAKAQQADLADLPVHKEYPDGFKWVELKQPEKLTDSQAKRVVKLRDAPGDVRSQISPRDRDGPGYVALDAAGKPLKSEYTGNHVIGKTPEETYLGGQLAQEGNAMGHCVGGYCEDVSAGKSKIYSLRGPDGKSHVTVEVGQTLSDPRFEAPEAEYEHWNNRAHEEAKDQGIEDGNELYDYVEGRVSELADEWNQARLPEDPLNIKQIKGKGNKAPIKDYLPYVQDFVRSGQWGNVGDLENTGLVDAEKTHFEPNQQKLLGGRKYLTREELAKIINQEKGAAAPAALAATAVGTGGAMASNNAQAAAPDAVTDEDLKKDAAAHPPPTDAVPESDYATDTDYAPPGETVVPRTFRLARNANRELMRPEAGTPNSRPLEKAAKGAGETAVNAGTGLLSTIGGGLGGLARTGVELGKQAMSDQPFSLDQAVNEGVDALHRGQETFTWQPRTAMGKLESSLLSSPFELLSEFAAGPTGAFVGRAAGNEAAGRTFGEAAPAVAAALMGRRGATQALEGRGVGRPPEAAPPGPSGQLGSAGVNPGATALPGSVGASATAGVSQRRALADTFPVPMGNDLTKGMATRDFAQLQFERETAKDAELGKPLRQNDSVLNKKIAQNMDAFLDQTGAEQAELHPMGKVVTQAVADKANAARGRYQRAYHQADKAGETLEQVSYDPLKKYIDGIGPTVRSKLAPIVDAVNDELAKNDPKGTGKVNIRQAEDVRKLINKLADPESPNGAYGKEMKGLIDEMTEGKGGKLYQQARQLRTRYSQEFENIGIIDRLLSTKKGTSDRKVAYEDVYQHTIQQGSLDDVRQVRRVLQTAGDDGKQAWRELQGATIRDMKDKMFASAAKDEQGNPIPSPAKLKKSVDALDKDGKLDFIFGKKGGQTLRDFSDTVADIETTPKDAVNHSNTVSLLKTVMDGMITDTLSGLVLGHGIPVPLATIAKLGKKRFGERKTRARVQEALQ